MTDSLEKLNAWYARQAKRHKRELDQHTTAAASGTSASPPQDKRARKLELSRRLVAGAIMPPPEPSRAPGPNDDGGEDE